MFGKRPLALCKGALSFEPVTNFVETQDIANVVRLEHSSEHSSEHPSEHPSERPLEHPSGRPAIRYVITLNSAIKKATT